MPKIMQDMVKRSPKLAHAVAKGLVGGVMAVSTATMFGWAFNIPQLYRVYGSEGMALNTAACLFLLSLAVLIVIWGE